MRPVRLVDLAGALPQPWSSQVIARFGDAQLKVLRMDESAYPEETHDYAEGLLVLEGELRLTLDGHAVRVGAGELCVVPAGVPHSVEGGSRGTLLIVDT
ncbi:MAG TPA: cupin domain-containing protein [Dyella sp.]|uniref:cupin domain-containing protein n=1 Tax=Dyella sp. TaxID=1869338 RepID=UPI002D781458|nr:cupin domain-containing protein [Dyella sp.]HET6553799.1 cupin domain-containing protein [Dyella sp.]